LQDLPESKKMKKYLTHKEVTDILKDNNIKNINLEDDTYVLMDESFFKPSLFNIVFGLKKYIYALGGSDCGKFAIRYISDLFKKYQNKFRANYFQKEEMPAPLIGLIKYRLNNGSMHIIIGTILFEDNMYTLAFFERTESTVKRVYLSNTEKQSIKYFHAY
jgi:hypothetical protein